MRCKLGDFKRCSPHNGCEGRIPIPPPSLSGRLLEEAGEGQPKLLPRLEHHQRRRMTDFSEEDQSLPRKLQPRITAEDWRCCKMGATQKPGKGDNLKTPQKDLATFCSPANSSIKKISRKASLDGYDYETSPDSCHLSVGGSYHSCISQITVDYDASGQLAIGLSHWKNPGTQADHHFPFSFYEDANMCQYYASQLDLSSPLSCPPSLSITPLPSYSSSNSSSSSQEMLSQDPTGKSLRHNRFKEISDATRFLLLLLPLQNVYMHI